MTHRKQPRGERGSLLLVIVFLATAIAGLAALGSGRVVAETKYQRVLEDEARALNDAYAGLHVAVNVVDNSPYNDQNENLELQGAIAGLHGGTAGGEVRSLAGDATWMADPVGVLHGRVRTTEVRVYRARDYIKRLQQLKGEAVAATIDPLNLSSNYFVLESTGRAGETVRLISALVRENEPFSSFVFFQNRHTLGVSGAPRGLIHSNNKIDFYFPNGNYVDSVSAVTGFGYQAGATVANTNVANGNPESVAISLEQVNFDELRSKANTFVGTPGLDAEIRMTADGKVRIRQYTPPRYRDVEQTFTESYVSGTTQQTQTLTRQVQTGTTTETRTRQVITGYTTQTSTVTVPVYGTETYFVTVPVYQTQQVQRTRQVPVYELQPVTRTRSVQVFVPYDTGGDGGGGTAVGGGGSGGQAGEYVWVQESYTVMENVIVGYRTETYMATEQVQVGTTQEQRTRQVQTGTTTQQVTTQVPVYGTEQYTVTVPVYGTETYESTQNVPVYSTRTVVTTVTVFDAPVLINTTTVTLGDGAGTIYIDGRVTKLSGDLKGRLTIVGNEKVRVTGDLRYVDDSGRTAMANGNDYTKPYVRNTDYNGHSVLGVIARSDVVFTRDMPGQAEINGTLMSTGGRVGIDGFSITSAGEPEKNWKSLLTPEQRRIEDAYDNTSYKTRSYVKDSMRRIGGIISNDRILETYIKPRSDGTSYVDSGFKRGSMKFDINLMFNPPPNFVEVPRPVVTYHAPVLLVRGEDT